MIIGQVSTKIIGGVTHKNEHNDTSSTFYENWFLEGKKSLEENKKTNYYDLYEYKRI